MKKRILFLITESDWGGTQRFLLEFIPFLSQQQNNYFTISIAAGGQGLILTELQRYGINVMHLKYLGAEHFSPFKDIKAFFEIYKLIQKESPDLLFLLSTKAGFYGSLAKGLVSLFNNKKIPTIYKIGGWAFTERISWIRKFIYFWIEKATAPLKNYIIVNSIHNYNLGIEKRICKKNKLYVAHNGLNLDTFKKELLEKNEARKKLEIQTSQTVIGTIANFYRTKGLTFFLDAIGLLLNQNPSLKKDIYFTIIGDGPERTLIESQIKALELKNNVMLTGALPHARQYLKAFDIFVLPSVKEGFPWALLEAMGTGLAIIATPVGGVPEMIENQKNGILIPAGDPEALMRAMLEMISNKELQKEYKEQAQLKAQEFSLDTMKQKYLEVIFRALE